MCVLSCFSRIRDKYSQKSLYNPRSDDDTLQILNLMIADNNLNIKCRQKLAEALIEQKRHR